MKSIWTCVLVGFALGIITAASGLTSIPWPVFIGAICSGVVLSLVLRGNDVLLKISISIAAWVTGSFIALNYLLPHAH